MVTRPTLKVSGEAASGLTATSATLTLPLSGLTSTLPRVTEPPAARAA